MDLSLSGKLLVAVLLASAFNTGLIWIVQLVHYPGFLRIPPEAYANYQQFHMKAISFIVAPSMVIELLLTLAGFAMSDLGTSYLYWVAVVCLGVVWAVTFFVSVPMHDSLASGYNAEGIQRLINTNWWRTVGWSLRTTLLLAIFLR
jgi:hypothetical protein